MSILSDTDRAKFKAEFGRDPRGPEDALSLRLESYRADVLSTPSETLAEAAKLLPFHPEDSPSPRAYLTKLARHFKDSLFTWVSQPACSRCGLGCAAGTLAYGEPTAAEAALGRVRRVEVWACGADGCGGSGRFPRYRDAGPVLLRTRRGRCGEWAKAFFLLCRASRTLDVRLVYDWTDHVWVEALLAPEEGNGGPCWTHCDVCEGVVGDGKMYERDWGKKLTWIFALGVDGRVEDVTRAYSDHWEEALARRKENGVDEGWLAVEVERISALPLSMAVDEEGATAAR